MGQINISNQTTAAAAVCAEPAGVKQACADPAACVKKGCARHAAARSAGPHDLLRASLNKGRALLRVYFHSRKVRAAANALAQALAESRESSSWPGDRLPVGEEMSAQVEKLTRRLKLETEAHNRFEALFRSVDLGRSAAAV
ncbi:hypothetical protein FBY31_2310 [Arthrobacter sp. SLBN-100]|uniref:hypothetical protein n=1 Tax=Arthrobacter sp. SLBN-100 TaxID=2768450 RepID=UPI001168BA70|nr:hypothetical protein [Arthrobacter sp. SLBN-100]TQJ68225.1 hypothetical protein FBY31_2310 [Arthrobacter sp. SLBN-100]